MNHLRSKFRAQLKRSQRCV